MRAIAYFEAKKGVLENNRVRATQLTKTIILSNV
jgi:hypothetical protein